MQYLATEVAHEHLCHVRSGDRVSVAGVVHPSHEGSTPIRSMSYIGLLRLLCRRCLQATTFLHFAFAKYFVCLPLSYALAIGLETQRHAVAHFGHQWCYLDARPSSCPILVLEPWSTGPPNTRTPILSGLSLAIILANHVWSCSFCQSSVMERWGSDGSVPMTVGKHTGKLEVTMAPPYTFV